MITEIIDLSVAYSCNDGSCDLRGNIAASFCLLTLCWWCTGGRIGVVRAAKSFISLSSFFSLLFAFLSFMMDNEIMQETG